MHDRRRRLALLIAACAAGGTVALAGARTEAASDEPDGGARGDVRTIVGKVSAVSTKDRKVTVDTGDGPVALEVDRNTVVYLDNRLGSLRDVVVGVPVRASHGPRQQAFWIEVRSRTGTATSPRPDGGDGSQDVPDGGASATAPQLPAPPEADGGTRDGGAVAGGAADAGATSPDAPSPQPPRGPEGPPPPGTGPAGGPSAPEPPPSGPGPIPGGPIRR
jgi:hypothetical protein